MNVATEVVNRVVKYLVEGLAIAAIALFLPKQSLKVNEVVMLAVTASAVFAILDLVSPSIAFTARQGAGFGIGANLVGFPAK